MRLFRIRWSLALVAAAALLWVAPSAMAQEPARDPSLNETDMDSGVPPADDRYLDEGNASSPADNGTSDPALAESDLDTAVPPPDDAYLDEPVPGVDAPAATTPAPRGVPDAGPAAAVLVGLGAAVALARPRRESPP